MSTDEFSRDGTARPIMAETEIDAGALIKQIRLRDNRIAELESALRDANTWMSRYDCDGEFYDEHPHHRATIESVLEEE